MVSTQDMLLKKYTYKQKHINTVSNTFYSEFLFWHLMFCFMLPLKPFHSLIL